MVSKNMSEMKEQIGSLVDDFWFCIQYLFIFRWEDYFSFFLENYIFFFVQRKRKYYVFFYI